ncbi:hypothetical protein [Carboxylicivirga sp. M1479]|uniref:hypothetical protein n=1 Tax=Carboxylicivirga sp. M1479 TaxID=2594476 RepID=UPI001177EECC|nr:hypothetical protein [Carboxylicivirga sp. M1479]TRX61094.1 hypothetical protein FNN09_20435 [Carboxylicivirga sp. M1479]
MKELNEKQEAFYTKWEQRRKKKWSYVFLQGSVYWGIPVALINFFIESQIEQEDMQFLRFLIYLLTFGIGGIWIGLSSYKRVDASYLALQDDDEIERGISEISKGNTWNYENLLIRQDIQKALIVQNDLLWFDDDQISAQQTDECFEQLMSDFSRLQKNKQFQQYAKHREVKIQVFDNSENEIPLKEKVVYTVC